MILFLCRICFGTLENEKEMIIFWDVDITYIRREIITEIVSLLFSNLVFIKKKLRCEYIKIKFQ